MTAVSRLIARAKGEVGYVETKTNKTKYAAELDALGDVYNGPKNGFDWCDVFVDWCFIKEFGEALGMKLLNQAYKGLGAGVRYSADYYKKAGRFYSKPQAGDQIFFKNGSTWTHTGIVTNVAGNYVYTVEGNAGSNADRVVECRYPVGASYIGGYGRPDWSLVPSDPVKESVYTVVKGDTLSGIAAKYGTTYQKLAEYNNISDPNKIYVGQVIRIPGSSSGSVVRTYTVKKGDSFWSIAEDMLGDGTRMYELAEYNDMSINDIIYPGEVLKIPS